MPKKTLDLILSLGCHFLVQIKRNRQALWEHIALDTALDEPISTYEYFQAGHGNEVYRRIELYHNTASLSRGWNGIQRFVKVRRWGFRNHQRFEERAFYILSKPLDNASEVAKAIQEHWSIENRLHWVKDVIMGEDDMTLRDKNTVSIVAYLNNTAHNVLRAAGYKNSKDTHAKFANKVKELIKLFQV